MVRYETTLPNGGKRLNPAAFYAAMTAKADRTSSIKAPSTVAPTLATGAVVVKSVDPDLAAVAFLPTVAELTGDRVFSKVPRQIDTQRWAIGGWIDRTITPNLDARLRFNFNRQISQSGSAGSSTDFDDFSVIFSFTYTLDQIEVW